MVRNMRTVSKWTVVPVVFLLAAAFSRAQIVELRDKGGKQIACVTSGLRGFGSFCGLDNDFYWYIFLGTILSVEPAENDEFRLHVHVDEPFRGAPPADIEAVTNQGQCMPDLRPGDRWLVYLRHEKERGQVLAYENDSKPLNGAEPELDLLRQMAKLEHAGLVSGEVNMPPHHTWGTSVPVANYQILLTRKSDSRTYRAFTDEKGHFNFGPLPAGDYVMDATTRQGLWTGDEGPLEVKPHGCMRYNIDLRPNGLITGRVTTHALEPIVNILVKAVPIGGNGVENSDWTDQHGRFTLRGVWPGQYLVGFGGDPGSSADLDKLEVAFPGVRLIDKAIPVDVGNAECRSGINIVVPKP
jgi:hypothetical protein